MGFLGSVFALSISLPPDPVVLVGQCTDTHKIPIFLFLKKTKHPNPVSACAASLVIWEFHPFLSPPPCCSLSNDRQLNPAFLPHFYRFLGYKRFHLLMHVPASLPPPWFGALVLRAP